jgi:uncharacterized membrane protein YdbT with pleckstrin-like domain
LRLDSGYTNEEYADELESASGLVGMTVRKPHRKAFLLGVFVIPAIALTLVAVAGAVVGVLQVGSWVALVVGMVWLAGVGLLYASASASYRKAHYEVHSDRIVIQSGGLFSDAELEVHYPNVTLVKWVRPWLSYKFFGVGHVYVEVAGSSAESIVLYCIADSVAAQNEIRRHMEGEFSLSTEELMHEEKPSGAAILLDIVISGGWTVIATVFALIYEFVPLLIELAQDGVDVRPEHFLWLLLGIPVLGVLIGFSVLRYMDLKRRVYLVYRDVIEYHEGFLTRCDAFMPVQNLSDSEVTRGIVQRLANAYNVVLSCQGAGQEVTFLHLKRGPELGAVLKSLIKTKRSPEAPKNEGDAPLAVEQMDSATGQGSAMPPPLPAAPLPEFTCRMHRTRSLLVLVPLAVVLTPLMIVAPPLIFFIYPLFLSIVRVFRTTFHLRDCSVGEHYDFIRVREREFSMDKVTGVVFRESVLDRMFKTITIHFWSIGAGKEISFRNVAKTDELISAIRSRANVDFGGAGQTISSQHSLSRFLCGNLIGLGVLAVVITGIIVAATYLDWLIAFLAVLLALIPVVGLIWGVFYYPRSTLELFREGMCFKRGILTRRATYVLYHNVKDVTTVKIPGHDCGSMRFNVAGERVVQNQQTRAAVPYGFTIHYVPEILAKNASFDFEVLAGEEPPVEVSVIEAHKALPNVAVRTVLISLVVLPLAALLPLSLPIILYRTSLVRYRIEPGRVLMRRGKLFLSQTSILFSRIDHIQNSAGMLNKAFDNGNVKISTAGSSSAELVLRDVKQHVDFYEALRPCRRPRWAFVSDTGIFPEFSLLVRVATLAPKLLPDYTGLWRVLATFRSPSNPVDVADTPACACTRAWSKWSGRRRTRPAQ